MKRSVFASLVGISKQMISRYALAGLVVEESKGELDPVATLERLAGRLNEGKRQAAFDALEALAIPRPTTVVGRAPNARVARHEIELALTRLKYERAARALVATSDVLQAADIAVSALREALSVGSRDIAAGICQQFGLSQELEIALALRLDGEFRRVSDSFAHSMTELATPAEQGFAHARKVGPAMI